MCAKPRAAERRRSSRKPKCWRQDRGVLPKASFGFRRNLDIHAIMSARGGYIRGGRRLGESDRLALTKFKNLPEEEGLACRICKIGAKTTALAALTCKLATINAVTSKSGNSAGRGPTADLLRSTSPFEWAVEETDIIEFHSKVKATDGPPSMTHQDRAHGLFGKGWSNVRTLIDDSSKGRRRGLWPAFSPSGRLPVIVVRHAAQSLLTPNPSSIRSVDASGKINRRKLVAQRGSRIRRVLSSRAQPPRSGQPAGSDVGRRFGDRRLVNGFPAPDTVRRTDASFRPGGAIRIQ
jgi:hypothetical protein